MTRLAFVSLLLSFFPLPCAFSFPSILSYWAVLLRLKYWSLLRLTLAWRSALLLIVQQIQTSIFFISSSFSFQTPFTLLWFFWGFFFFNIYIYKAAVSYSCHRIRLFISLAPEVVTLHRGRPILQTQQLFSQFSPAKNLYAMLLNFLRLKGDDFEKTKQVMFVICVLFMCLSNFNLAFISI